MILSSGGISLAGEEGSRGGGRVIFLCFSKQKLFVWEERGAIAHEDKLINLGVC